MNRPFYQFLRLILATPVTHFLNVTYIGRQELKTLEPPYIVLANHTHFWDPVLVAKGVPQPIHFVTSDEQFRKKILKNLLPYVGAIPKVKFFSDAQTVKTILKVKKKKGVIGIFPEGARSWDGATLEILFPTAKLVKSLKLPVVTAVLQGAALSRPRWASNSRRGKITIKYNILLTSEQVADLSAEEIYETIVQGLAHDEYTLQDQVMIPFKGKQLAERLERFLFLCPKCHQIGQLKSADDRFYCKCGYQTRYTEYGYFEPISNPHHFRHPREWNLWQLDQLTQRIDTSSPNDLIFADQDVEIYQGEKASPLVQIGTGRISLYQNQIHFTGNAGQVFLFPIQEVQGANIQHNQLFEFYHQRRLYRFVFQSPHASAYKWTEAVRLLKNSDLRRDII